MKELYMQYKHDYDKALTRLISILTKLYNGESLSVKNLAEEFNVSTRTIQRDFNERLISFPIYQENRLWKMQDGFKLEKTTSIEEQIVLDIIDKLVEGLGDKFSSKAKSLLAKIKNENINPIYTKINMEDIGDKLEVIKILESSIKLKHIINCTYNIKENKTCTLKIKPLKIVNYEGFWYLIALDTYDNNILKKYYLKNIFNVKTTDEKFDINLKLEELLENSISIWFQENYEPYEIKIRVSSVIAKYIKRKPISITQRIESVNKDNSIDIVFKVTHEMEIIPLVKYWMPHMKIIEPKWIDDKILIELKDYINFTLQDAIEDN
jgi:predicted DNA-binding transcriptional regulator YafY